MGTPGEAAAAGAPFASQCDAAWHTCESFSVCLGASEDAVLPPLQVTQCHGMASMANFALPLPLPDSFSR